MTRFGEADIVKLLDNAGIVRSRAKIEVTIGGARAYLAMRDAGEDFSTIIWDLVGGSPIRNSFSHSADSGLRVRRGRRDVDQSVDRNGRGRLPIFNYGTGSYQLSGNLMAPSGESAITILPSNVSIDLNGFTISCSVVLPNAVKCIDGTSGVTNVIVRNGVIQGSIAGGSGGIGSINISGIALTGAGNTLEDMRIALPLSNFPTFGNFFTVSVGSLSTSRRSTLTGGGSITCPSIVTENIHIGGAGNNIFLSGSGCAGISNVGMNSLP